MNTKAIILTAAIIVGLAAPARAQDGASSNWKGFYLGVSVDAANTKASVKSSATHSYGTKTAMLGVYGGYNFTNGNGFVWGPELAITGVDTGGTRTDVSHGTTNFTGAFVITPKMRAGFATDKFFVYGTLGLGITNAAVKPAANTSKDWTAGIAYGVGVEMAMRNGWSTRIEASTTSFNNDGYTYGGTAAKMDMSRRVISIGLTRRF